MQDFIFILKWWGVFFGLGIIFLPIAASLFKNFFDKGYVFSKVLGMVIVSYLVFLLGIFHLVPFGILSILIAAVVLSFINYYFLGKNILKILQENWAIFVFEELIFFLALVGWSFVRANNPEIHGLEKYMDFGFVNSILRSDFFPPKDMWFAPFSINYYYFGHLITAVLTKISGIPSYITYNLMLATLFAFTFTCSFSIGANLIYILKSQIQNHSGGGAGKLQNKSLFGDWKLEFGILVGGFMTAFLVSLSGNLQVVYTFFKNFSPENPLPFWQLPFSLSEFPNNYWYPNATRFIHNTIHEFPSYSFVVSDLHGHVLDIPMVLLTISILLSLFFNLKPSTIFQFKRLRISNFEIRISLISFLLAVMYMTNVWDGVIYLLLTLSVIFVILLKSPHSEEGRFEGVDLIKYSAILMLGFFIFSLPFNFYFKPFASGIGILCSPDFLLNLKKIGPLLFEANHCQRSPLWQLLILHGFFYFFVVSFVVFIARRIKIKKSILKFGEIFPSDMFVLLLIFISTLLLLIPEFIYLKDIYPAHYRANTMFKLTYQEFIMLSIASCYTIFRVISNYNFALSNYKKHLFLIFSVFLLALVLSYPFFAVGSFYNNLKIYRGLDGISYLKNIHPDDYQAILWINQNIKKQPVILEAQGDSYTDFARISSNTGLPTVLGWTVHEWLWRGTYDIPAPRITEVETMYSSNDIEQTKNLLNKYKVSYIYIGGLEREKYKNLNEDKFKKIGKPVYGRGNVKIYLLN